MADLKTRTCRLLVAVVTIVAAATLAPRDGAAIGIGFNALKIVNDGTSRIVFEDPTSPGNFLTVGLRGDAGPSAPDVLIQRLTPLPAGQTGTIDTEIIAMDLSGFGTVNVGGNPFEVFVKLDLQNRSLGRFTVQALDPNNAGGTYDAFFDVFVEIELVDPNSGQVGHTIGQSHRLDVDPHYTTLDSFYYGAFPNGGMHLDPFALHTADKSTLFLSLESAPLPEPGMLAVLGLGVAGLALGRRRLGGRRAA